MLASLLLIAALAQPHTPVTVAAPRVAAPQAATAEVIAELRVHGNEVTSEADVLALAGVHVGDPVGPGTIEDIRRRLNDSHKFVDVQVLKRFASIADATQITIVIIVNEGPVKVEMPKDGSAPRVVRRRGLSNLLWFPILSAEDGYGLTFGARLALVNVGGRDGRLSFPLTWGGTREAGVEYERLFMHAPLSRMQFGSSIQQQTNPAFQIDDARRSVWARAERSIARVRIGGTAKWQHVSFDTDRDDIRSIGADVTFDTRVDPLYPRNAIYAQAAVEHVSFAAREPGGENRMHLEAEGDIGFIGQTVIAVSARKDDADQAQPRYLQSLLGGWSSLRGFAAGAFTGDTLVTGSVELRVPLTSVLSVAKVGVSAFVDSGATYAKPLRLRDAAVHTGVGGSVWVAAAVFRLSFAVAHGLGATTRVNFGAQLAF